MSLRSRSPVSDCQRSTKDKERRGGLGDVCVTFWTLRSLGKGRETPTLSFSNCGMSYRVCVFSGESVDCDMDDVKDVGLSLFHIVKSCCSGLGRNSLVFV